MNTVHVCSTWMLQTVDKDCCSAAFFCFNMIPDSLFFSAQAALQEQQAMERAMMGSMPFGVMSYSFSFS